LQMKRTILRITCFIQFYSLKTSQWRHNGCRPSAFGRSGNLCAFPERFSFSSGRLGASRVHLHILRRTDAHKMIESK
jgi:hypothetical protein